MWGGFGMSEYKCVICNSEALISSDLIDDFATVNCKSCSKIYRVTGKNLRWARFNPLSENDVQKIGTELGSDPDYLLKNTLYY